MHAFLHNCIYAYKPDWVPLGGSWESPGTPKSTPKWPQVGPKLGPKRDISISSLFCSFFVPLGLRLGPNLGPTWGPKFYIFSKDPTQEASKRSPGAFFKGVKKRPQHRKLLRSIFHRFLDHFRSPWEGENEVPVGARIKFSLFCMS